MPGTEWEERIVGFDEFVECSGSAKIRIRANRPTGSAI